MVNNRQYLGSHLMQGTHLLPATRERPCVQFCPSSVILEQLSEFS